MTKSCKPWCGVARILPYSQIMGRTWCTKKCRDKAENKEPRKPASVMQAFEKMYGPLGNGEDVN